MKSNHALAKNLMNLALILLGNAIYALAVTMFILPAGLITGGTTGLALFFFHQFGLPVTACYVPAGTLDSGEKICTDHTGQYLLLPVYSRGIPKNSYADSDDG